MTEQKLTISLTPEQAWVVFNAVENSSREAWGYAFDKKNPKIIANRFTRIGTTADSVLYDLYALGIKEFTQTPWKE